MALIGTQVQVRPPWTEVVIGIKHGSCNKVHTVALTGTQASPTSLVFHKGVATGSQQHVQDLVVVALGCLMQGRGAEGAGSQGMQIGAMLQQLHGRPHARKSTGHS